MKATNKVVQTKFGFAKVISTFNTGYILQVSTIYLTKDFKNIRETKIKVRYTSNTKEVKYT